LIISHKTAIGLVKAGRAKIEGYTRDQFTDKAWMILDRSDFQRVDHYLATDQDVERITAKREQSETN
jgi:hypothetical protein